MRSGQVGMVVLATAIAIAGCAPWQSDAPVVPSSYESSRAQVQRTVGQLRRLAIVQIAQDAPAVCTKGSTAAARLDEFSRSARQRLTQTKGYDLVELDPVRHAAWIAPPGDATFVQELLDLGEARGSGVGPSVRALLERLRLDDRVDALLVAHDYLSCDRALPGGRQVLGLATLGLAEIMVDPALLLPKPGYALTVVETAGARVVWRDTILPWTLRDFWLSDAERAERPRGIEALADRLEPAVPAILVR